MIIITLLGFITLCLISLLCIYKDMREINANLKACETLTETIRQDLEIASNPTRYFK